MHMKKTKNYSSKYSIKFFLSSVLLAAGLTCFIFVPGCSPFHDDYEDEDGGFSLATMEGYSHYIKVENNTDTSVVLRYPEFDEAIWAWENDRIRYPTERIEPGDSFIAGAYVTDDDKVDVLTISRDDGMSLQVKGVWRDRQTVRIYFDEEKNKLYFDLIGYVSTI